MLDDIILCQVRKQPIFLWKGHCSLEIKAMAVETIPLSSKCIKINVNVVLIHVTLLSNNVRDFLVHDPARNFLKQHKKRQWFVHALSACPLKGHECHLWQFYQLMTCFSSGYHHGTMDPSWIIMFRRLFWFRVEISYSTSKGSTKTSMFCTISASFSQKLPE